MIPRNCDFCQEVYQAEPRYLNRGQGLFCSRSCATKCAASRREKPSDNAVCETCKKPFYRKESSLAKSSKHFCSRYCQDIAISSGALRTGPQPKSTSRHCSECSKKHSRRDTEWCLSCDETVRTRLWLAGDNSVTIYSGEAKDTRKFVKRYLISTRGDKCEVCGFDEKAPDGRSIIQMDHINGNCFDNSLDNLRLLCPNHHAMTPNYGSLNKGSGRAHRRKNGTASRVAESNCREWSTKPS